jgi:hypothetical protein
MARLGGRSSSTPSGPWPRPPKDDELVDEATAAGGRDHPNTIHVKMLRLELLNVKAYPELETWVPDCTKCGLDVHWVSGSPSIPPPHREPAPHGEPAV